METRLIDKFYLWLYFNDTEANIRTNVLCLERLFYCGEVVQVFYRIYVLVKIREEEVVRGAPRSVLSLFVFIWVPLHARTYLLLPKLWTCDIMNTMNKILHIDKNCISFNEAGVGPIFVLRWGLPRILYTCFWTRWVAPRLCIDREGFHFSCDP